MRLTKTHDTTHTPRTIDSSTKIADSGRLLLPELVESYAAWYLFGEKTVGNFSPNDVHCNK